MNRPLIEVHTADLHFGAMDSKVQYDILMEQMINKVAKIPFDVFFINGDIFHHKFMSNSDAVMYASLFVDQIVRLCIQKNATLVLLHGTYSHDSDQLKLFYHYIGMLDIRIVEHMKFEYIKGSKVLCIPEEYNKGEEYYKKALYYSGKYDMVVLHGVLKGSLFGADKQDLDSEKVPVFDFDCFVNCQGPIICGHVHVPGCYENHMYYSGSPLRWKFGEEQDKGFIICLYDIESKWYYIDFEVITSFRYDTVTLDDMLNCNVEDLISHILQLKASGINYLKIKFNQSNAATDMIRKHFATYPDITIDIKDTSFQNVIQENQRTNNEFKEYEYITDTNISPYEIFARYVNQMKNDTFITVDELLKILEQR